MIEDLDRMNSLLDIYGPLLTVKQQQIMRLHYSEDLSLNEIAEETGTSKAAVSDLIRRTGKILEDYESKLHIEEKSKLRRELYNQLLSIQDEKVLEYTNQLINMESEEI